MTQKRGTFLIGRIGAGTRIMSVWYCLANARTVIHIAPMPHTGRISINPDVCGGRPVIRGTRLRVVDVLDMLAGGTSEAMLLADFPFLVIEDIRAALAYAARAIDHKVVLAA